MRMRNINDRRGTTRARARRRDAAWCRRARETARASAAILRLRSHRVLLDTREVGMGVMATCNNIVDSYCFVIGRCDASAPPSDAAPNILCRGRFIGNFSRPTSGFPRFFRSRGGRDDAALFHIRFLPTRVFALFFCNSFLYFFSHERHRVKFEASE